ncbi:LPP20 family lipoprotein [Arcobacter sp.]|uniref:LPP20 family lipoprotein n=1 Tax=Arcobacter sp. TaxID=1872629 RepID=UPI003D147262
MLSLIKVISSVLLVAYVFSGCSDKQSDIEAQEQSIYVDPEFEGAPKWIHKPSLENKISEVGSAVKNAGNDFAFQREEAIANARDNIARRISIKVNNMFKSYKGTTGLKDEGTFDKVIEGVSKQISSQTINNSIVENLWISKSKTMYVLVSLDTDALKATTKKVVKSSFKNDEALYQKFLAEESDKKLDAMVESLGE